MAIKNVNKENILVKVDQNNLISIDPNTVIEDGYIVGRDIKQENLVMYVNLEADLIPRTTLASSEEGSNIKSIARGTFNLLNNRTGRDFDTTWTDSYYDIKEVNSNQKSNEDIFYQSDETGQSFGIQDINVSIKANFIPQVNITFIDVRGKTLFEAPKNSPYNAFFHLPWPVFYLTIKGYYGKAIRYRLHLTHFSSRYNDANGNFEISTTFVGSTYAYLNDIPLNGILNAPYMFSRENEVEPQYNEQRGVWERRISKTTKGYLILKSVYNEMKQKNLIPQDFPVKTVRELGIIAESLDKLLEKVIFDEVVDAKVLNAINDYSKKLTDFQTAVQGWADNNLTSSSVDINEKAYYRFNYSRNQDVNSVKLLGKEDTGTLEFILETYKTDLNKQLNTILTTQKKAGFKSNMLSKKINNITSYYTKHDFKGGLGAEYVVAYYVLLDDVHELVKTFNEEKDKVEKLVEEKMNEIIKNKNVFGFEPTIRNLFAVLLANAEVYLRLLKDTHIKAFNVGNSRKNVLNTFNDETAGEPIYPWPQVRKELPGKNKHEIVYPGEPEMRNKLKSYDALFWPEVDFVEDYIKTASLQTDPLSEKEGGLGNINYVFRTDEDKVNKTAISNLYTPTRVTPYTNMSPAAFLFEIYERAKTITLNDSFNQNTIKEMALNEFDSLKETIAGEITITELLKNNIFTYNDLIELMTNFAPIDNLQYYKDAIPTTNYITDLNSAFFLETFDKTISVNATNDEKYEKLKENLNAYVAEDFRQKIYPFNSTEYLSYIGKTIPDTLRFNGTNMFNTSVGDTLISTPIDANMWKKEGYNNLFSQALSVDTLTTNILNTPYFHKQLYSDFEKPTTYGRYAGSAYLLLNSMPLKDLEDYMDEGNTMRMSSMFKEIGATHFVPYYTILKWGSLYHRYKKYLIDGEDILDGFLNSSGTTESINGDLFFRNGDTSGIFDIVVFSAYTLSYDNQVDVGVHPFYDAIFHQIVNGYNHYNISNASVYYKANLEDFTIITTKRTTPANQLVYWTTFVDNSKYDSTDNRYTLLPCDGFNKHINFKSATEITEEVFTNAEQNNFRIIWGDEWNTGTFSGATFPSYGEYNRTINDEYALDESNKKVFDLIGTFNPSILERFEELFLSFASEKLNVENEEKPFTNLTITKFQTLLKEIVSVDKNYVSKLSGNTLIFDAVKTAQQSNLEAISNQLLDTNLVKFTIGNPKEYDAYTLEGFSGALETSTLSFNSFNVSQLTTDNLALLDLYIGEFPDSGTNYYTEFFQTNNVQLNEENILQLRPLILMYAGYRKAGNGASATTFKNYIKSNIFTKSRDSLGMSGANNRMGLFLDNLIKNFSKLKRDDNLESIRFTDGYNLRGLKVELYNNFKSFNDRWTAGNSIGQNLLLEDFLFLNKANADIGNIAYLNIDKFKNLNNPGNANVSLYGAISMMLQGTGFDIRPLPAYVNFYGNEIKSKFKATPSSTIADNMFGTFLDVDYEASAPKIVIQLVSQSSKHPDNPDSIFKDDSFDITESHDNPLLITAPEAFSSEVLQKSNKVVAFEVSFGDQNQGIFKGLTLDQSSLKNTSESYIILEELGRSESGASTHNVDVSLYDYYRLASYTCEVKCMGNVMIQPTMFFYLKNIPMFRGTYWITDVTHKMINNTIETTFTGSRLPRTSLPDAEDSFVANYRPLFDKILNKAIAYVNNSDKRVVTENVLSTADGNYTIDKGEKIIAGEKIIPEAGITQYGIPYNGKYNEKYIQKVEYYGIHSDLDSKKVWLRAVVARMGGPKYPIDNATDMSIIGSFVNQNINTDEVKWERVKDRNETNNFYSSRFQFNYGAKPNNLLNAKTQFFNPENGKKITVTHSYNLDSDGGVIETEGPINRGPYVDGYGIAMSYKLMLGLGLHDGDVIYFDIIE